MEEKKEKCSRREVIIMNPEANEISMIECVFLFYAIETWINASERIESIVSLPPRLCQSAWVYEGGCDVVRDADNEILVNCSSRMRQSERHSTHKNKLSEIFARRYGELVNAHPYRIYTTHFTCFYVMESCRTTDIRRASIRKNAYIFWAYVANRFCRFEYMRQRWMLCYQPIWLMVR